MSAASDSPLMSITVPEQAPVKANPRQEASNDMKECVDRVLHTDARVPVSTYREQCIKTSCLPTPRPCRVPQNLGIGDFDPRPSLKPGRTARTAMTSRATIVSILSSAERKALPISQRSWNGRVWVYCSISSPTIWAWATTPSGGRTCWRMGTPRSTPNTSTSTGSRSRPRCATSFSCRSWGDQYGAELEAKHIQVSMEDGQALIHYYDHTCPPRRVHCRSSSTS